MVSDAFNQILLGLFLMVQPWPLFLFILGLFKQTIPFSQKINEKKCHVHPAYVAGIWTHDLANMSRLQ